eukprot:scaffold1638_cov112-Skeletonema_dohrnii-CCMP3373.AAC.16
MSSLLSCKSPLTKACMGLTDPRYDPAISNNLIDQDSIWKEFSGYWGPEERIYADVGGKPRVPRFYNPNTKSGWPYRSDKMMVFRSIKVDGTRYTQKAFYFYEPAPAAFCELTPPEGLLNTVGDGVCGENGNFQFIEDFGTASYEKDGTIDLVWKNQGPDSDETAGPPKSKSSTLAPADNYGVFAYTDMGFFNVAETFTFSGENRGFLLATATATKHQPSDENFERIVSSSLSSRMPDESSFMLALKKAFDDHNVEASRVPGWVTDEEVLPKCIGNTCPDEDYLCSEGKDPNCSVSPYTEPSASLNGAGFAVIILGVLSVVGVVFYFINRHIVNKQKERYRIRFAEQIAEELGHKGSIEQLSCDDLAKEFHRIDESGDGSISKEELYEFISSGKAGVMSDHDFNALFKSLDLDGNGEINFLEFCAFMALCGQSCPHGAARRLSMAPEEIAKLIDEKKIN